MVILKISFDNPSQVATYNMNHGSYIFIIWITINCYQLLFREYLIYYWENIFTWKKHQNFMNCCSPNLFKFKSIPRVIEKCVATRRLKKKVFQIIRKNFQKTNPWRSLFLVRRHAKLHVECFRGSFQETCRTAIQQAINSGRV